MHNSSNPSKNYFYNAVAKYKVLTEVPSKKFCNSVKMLSISKNIPESRDSCKTSIVLPMTLFPKGHDLLHLDFVWSCRFSFLRVLQGQMNIIFKNSGSNFNCLGGMTSCSCSSWKSSWRYSFHLCAMSLDSCRTMPSAVLMQFEASVDLFPAIFLILWNVSFGFDT